MHPDLAKVRRPNRRYGPARGMRLPTVRPRHRTHWQPPGEQLLRSASFYIDARDLTSSTQQTLPNRADGGATVATMGSTGGSETSDPTRLPHDGTNYVYLPGTTDNYLSRALASTAGTNQLTMVARLLDGWGAMSGGYGSVLSYGSNSTHHVSLYLKSGSDHVRIFVRGTGNIAHDTGDVALPGGLTRASVRWLRITANPVGGAYTVEGSASTTTDEAQVAWTTISTGTSTGMTEFPVSTPSLNVGSLTYAPTTQLATIKPTHARFTIGTTTYTMTPGPGQATAGDFTVNRATTGLATMVVTGPVFTGDASDDIVTLPTEARMVTPLTGGGTVVVAARAPAAQAATAILYDARSAPTVGYSLQMRTTNQVRAVASGTTLDLNTIAMTPLTPFVAAMAVAAGGGTLTGYLHNGSTALAGGTALAIAEPVQGGPRLMSYSPSVTSLFRGSIFAAAVWNRALTQTELDVVSAHLLAGR